MALITILKVEPLKKPETVTMEDSLRALQEAVGGDIEMVTLSSKACLLLNEEGIRLELTPNRRFGNDVLLGTFLIVGIDGEEIVSLSQDLIQEYIKRFETPEVIDPREKLRSIYFRLEPGNRD